MTESYDDEELAARLRAADPASTLPPAAPERVARLLEETMSHDPSTRSESDLLGTGVLTESRETGTRGRGPLTWLVAAAAAVLIVGSGFLLLRDGNADDAPPVADAPGLITTALSAPDPARAGRCMVPSAGVLATKPVAFDGTVQSVEDGMVTLAPTRWYAGEPTARVTVEGPSDHLRSLVVSLDFEEGGRYLVAASEDGDVMVCGFSAPYSEDLAAMYADAFGR